ncbi:GNAT family N-acetyltransferase [Sulfitobacter sp. JB4-11]|uniref:GNAT family N-acetyltransferase n=1 Tax=Sulfitobacter rhodophyticola TaxID=3238304 RepID=UPI00351220C2
MVEIAHAKPDEREEIAQFMDRVFTKARWGMDQWRALLVGRWSKPEDIYAVTVRDGTDLVGVLGLVTAHRPTEAGPRITANMSSWYVLKPFRGGGVGRRMVECAAADPAVTVTNFTSSPNAVRVIEQAGLTVLDRDRLIWHPRTRATKRLSVHDDPLGSGLIGDRDARVVADHAGLNLTPLLIETPDGPLVLVLAIKQKSDDRVTHEIMYLGDRDLFARHARAIADSLLPASGAILSVDPRLVPPEITPDTTEPFSVPRYYTPGRMDARAIDHLYSETVLLDVKLF